MTTPYAFGYEIGQLKFAAAPMTEQQYRLADIEAKKNRLRGLGNQVNQVKQVTPAVDDPFEEIAAMDSQANQLDRAPGSRPSGNNTGSFTGGHLTTVNGQRQRLTPEQQEDVDAAKEMSNSFNNMNAGGGGAGRGGMAPAPVQPRVTLPVNRGPAAPAPAYQGRQRAPAAATPPPAAQTPAQNLAAMRVAQSKADAAAVRGASGTPNPMGNGLHSFSGRVGGPGAPTGTYTPPAGRSMSKLPSGPTSSPDFKGAVE